MAKDIMMRKLTSSKIEIVLVPYGIEFDNLTQIFSSSGYCLITVKDCGHFMNFSYSL